MTATPLAIVVALAENGVIGRDNALPWRLRSDLRHFREVTWGKPLIMGRRCWDGIGRPLPGRETVVMSRRVGLVLDGAHVASDWKSAKMIAARLAGEMGADEIAVVGGTEIYRLALPEVSRLHLTRVHARPDGDVFFPSYDEGAFREVARRSVPAGPADDHPTSVTELVRALAGEPPVHRDAAGR